MEENFDKGYDSDGECGPFMIMEDVEGEQIFDEPELGERASDELGTKDGATVVTNDDDADEDISNEVEGGDIDHTEGDSAAAYHIPIDEADLVKMSRDAIKKELRLRGQRSSGNKGELLGRLRKALEDKVVGGIEEKIREEKYREKK